MDAKQNTTTMRYAVVTGANKGIGLETVRQLATSGVMVVLAARNENTGKEAVALLHESGLSNVIFHQLDVTDPDSISSFANFLEKDFGRLDILVNNAGVSEKIMSPSSGNTVEPVWITTYESASHCVNTNYYGCKRVTEALLPLLQLSDFGASIVNLGSTLGELKKIPDEVIRKKLNDIDTLTEEGIHEILEEFLNDFKQGNIKVNEWAKAWPAYSISKAALGAYTRILAKKHPKMRINCVHPGYVDTDINNHTGILSVEEGAKGSVMAALLDEGGPTGCYFFRTEVAEF